MQIARGQYAISLSLERPVSAIDGLDQGLDRFDDFDLDTQLNRIIRRYPASLCFERKRPRSDEDRKEIQAMGEGHHCLLFVSDSPVGRGNGLDKAGC